MVMNMEAVEEIGFLTNFWTEKYLKEYIAYGGSKIKFVTGKRGSGKTHLITTFAEEARQQGYITVCFSAKDVWLHDFREVYLEILKYSDFMKSLKGCGAKIIENMGYRAQDIPEGMSFIDYLAQEQMSDAINKREIRMQLKEMFLDNPLLDNNFALTCTLLTGSLLGYPVLEEQNKALLMAWLYDDRTVKQQQLRKLGLAAGRITKYNARHMLRSLAEVIHMGGSTGLLVEIDDLEMLISRSSLEKVHYTKMKREDTYESIRQLIDDIDSMNNIMFVYAFDRSLIDEENVGIKSYQALWMRIQNEVMGERFNKFEDVIDMDRMVLQVYTPALLVELSRQILKEMQKKDAVPIDEQQAADIIEQAKLGGVGVPQLIVNAIQGSVD